jgi:hypothetical protein
MSDWQPDFGKFVIDLSVPDAQDTSAEVVLVYVDTSRIVGDTSRAKMLASLELAKTWFTESDPTGTAFEYSLIDRVGE